MTENLVKKTAFGIGWNILSQGSQQVIRFVIIIILARLLNPADFGIFAMVMVFTEFIKPFREWGFQAALIQKEDIDHEYQSTAFWSICGLAVILYLVSLAAAPFVGWFFHSPLVAQIIPVVAIVFLFSPFGAVQWAMFNRKLDFKIIAFLDTASTLCYGICACALALNGFGVWSLAVATVVRELVYSLLFWFSYSWRPLFSFSIKKFRELLSFSVACMGAGTLNYGINNFDNIMVGKFLGTAPLGFYNMALNTVTQPETRIVSQISSVIFPVYSMIKGDVDRMREAYLKTVKVIAAITVPIISVLFVAAPDFVTVFYGQKWLPAVLPIRIMCFYGLARAFMSIASPVFLSKGRPDIDLKLTIFRLCVFISCISLGIRHGIAGVALGALAYSLISFVPTFYICDKMLGIKNSKFYGIILKYTALSLVIIVSLRAMNSYSPWIAGARPILRLAADTAAGLCIYLALSFLLLRRDFDTFIKLGKKVFS